MVERVSSGDDGRVTMDKERCERFRCGKEAVGLGTDDGLACYWHESKESYLARTRDAMEGHAVPSNISPNDSTWHNY